MTQHIDLSLVGRVRDTGIRAEEEKEMWRVAYNGEEGGGKKEGGIKYTLSVKSTFFWDFSMHTVLPEMYVAFSPELRRHQRDRWQINVPRLTFACCFALRLR